MKKSFKIAVKSEIPSGKIKKFKVEDKTLAIANVRGEFFAFDDECTHAGCSLAGSFLDGHIVTCYCHGAQFDIKTGKVLAPPARKPLDIYKVEMEGEDIFIEIKN